MNIQDGNYKSSDGKEYFTAVIDKQEKTTQIFKNFSCTARIENFLEEFYKISYMEMRYRFRTFFMGDHITEVPKKYSKFKII
jgi:hypothetical protein